MASAESKARRLLQNFVMNLLLFGTLAPEIIAVMKSSERRVLIYPLYCRENYVETVTA